MNKNNSIKSKVLKKFKNGHYDTIIVREGCTKYDLYISNYYRDNAFIRLGPKYDNKPKSAFEILYEENPACYETMLNRFKNIQEKMICYF